MSLRVSRLSSSMCLAGQVDPNERSFSMLAYLLGRAKG
jgi:hypothetical protein